MAWADTGNAAATAGGGVTPISVAYPNNCVSGSLLLCALGCNTAGSGTAVSDNVNGAWTLAKAGSDVPNTQQLEIWYFNGNTSTGKPTVTVARTGGIDMIMFIWEKTGQATSSITDGSNSNVAADTATTNGTLCGSITTTADGDLLVGFVACDSAGPSSYVAGTSPMTFTLRGSSVLGLAVEDGVQVSHAAINAAFTGDGAGANYLAIAAAFKPAASTAKVAYNQAVAAQPWMAQ